jgi:hypothetical protein
LLDGSPTVVRKASSPISQRPKINKGSEATDFGFLVLSKDQLNALRTAKGWNEGWARKYIGGDEFINSIDRHCLWLVGANANEIRTCAPVMNLISKVEQARKISEKPRTREWAKYPSLFSENRQPQKDYIIIPKVSSQTRDYIPIGKLPKDVIVSGSAQFIVNDESFVLAILMSRIHMTWMRTVGGRTKSDYQYTNTLVYNPFPWPDLDDAKKAKLDKLGQAILDARLNHPQSTLADLYDPLAMPADLRKAHEANDKAVDQLYRKEPFASDRARVEFLLARYEQMTAPALALAAQKPKRVKKLASTPPQLT